GGREAEAGERVAAAVLGHHLVLGRHRERRHAVDAGAGRGHVGGGPLAGPELHAGRQLEAPHAPAEGRALLRRRRWRRWVGRRRWRRRRAGDVDGEVFHLHGGDADGVVGGL